MLCNRSVPVWYNKMSSLRKLVVQLLLACLIGLFQIVGPSLCCCDPVCNLVKPATPLCVTILNHESMYKCSRCHAKSEQPADPKSGSTPKTPVRCPCSGIFLEPATPFSTISFEIIQALTLWEHDRFVGLLDLPSASANADSALDEHSVCDLPFMTTAVRLYAHHVLRC